jgi:hypothetical protein
MISRRRSGTTAPLRCFKSSRGTAKMQSHLQSVGQSRPSASSKITSLSVGARLARWELQSSTSTKSFRAARAGCEMITTGCKPHPKSHEYTSHEVMADDPCGKRASQLHRQLCQIAVLVRLQQDLARKFVRSVWASEPADLGNRIPFPEGAAAPHGRPHFGCCIGHSGSSAQ